MGPHETSEARAMGLWTRADLRTPNHVPGLNPQSGSEDNIESGSESTEKEYESSLLDSQVNNIPGSYQEDHSMDVTNADSEHSQREWEQTRKENEHLKRRLKESLNKNHRLQIDLEFCLNHRKDYELWLMEANQRAKSALKAQLGAEEKFRQQTENLKQLSEKLEEAKKQNTILLQQQMQEIKLSKWNEQIDDEEICRTMNSLFRELEAWTKSHLSHCAPFCEDGNLNSLWAIVSYRVCERCLEPELIAIGGQAINDAVQHQLSELSEEVQNIC